MEVAAERSKRNDTHAGLNRRMPEASPADPLLHPVQQLQQQAGNQAVQELLRSGVIQAKLAISNPSDPEELEADRVAERVMRAHDGQAFGEPCPCMASGGEMCDACKQKYATIHRQATGTDTPSTVPRIVGDVLRSPGQPLDAATRAFFEPRFGRDFSQVRVHASSPAAKSAHKINALAYTMGEHLVFAKDQYAPRSTRGAHLLAHELAHVVQQQSAHSNAIQRQLAGELNVSMTPEYARKLSDSELANDILSLQTHIDELSEDDPEYEAVQSNLSTLQAEQMQRSSSSSVTEGKAAGEIPRPVGLPMDQGYVLHPATDDLQALASTLPEGQIVTIVQMPNSAQGGGTGSPQPTKIGAPFGGAAVATTMNANAQLMSQGFAAAGENSIVIVALPRWGTPGAMIPESTSVWGHTAVGVRVGRQIQTVRGFSPESLAEIVKNYSGVRSGAAAVPAEITNDISLLTKTGALTLEYPVSREVAEAFARGLPPIGPVGVGGPGYTAVPASFGNVCQGQNCVLSATTEVEQALGGRIGPVGGTPITDVPQVGQAGQGQLVRFIRNVSEGTEEAAPLEGAIGPAIASGMPKTMQILKVGGRVMIVVSIAMIPVETYLAPPEERERTFLGATGGVVGGFAGGFAAGAVAGIVCGPGAPVCSLVLGLAGGVAGSVGGRAIVEGAYDLADSVGKMTPADWIETSTQMFGTPEQKRAQCEMKEIEGIDDPMCD